LVKEMAPSDELRRRCAHDWAKWREFEHRCFAKIVDKPEAWWPLREAAREGNVTLLHSARHRKHNNAVSLKAYLGRIETERNDDRP
jgi:uncharacterized protein YeaO (DUF488 family)